MRQANAQQQQYNSAIELIEEKPSLKGNDFEESSTNMASGTKADSSVVNRASVAVSTTTFANNKARPQTAKYSSRFYLDRDSASVQR